MPNFDLWRIKNYSSISHHIPIFISHNIPIFIYNMWYIHHKTIYPTIFILLLFKRWTYVSLGSDPGLVASLLAIAQLPRGLVELDLVLLRCGIGAKGAKASRFFLAMATVVRLGFLPGFMVDIYGYIIYYHISLDIYSWIVGLMFQKNQQKTTYHMYIVGWRWMLVVPKCFTWRGAVCHNMPQLCMRLKESFQMFHTGCCVPLRFERVASPSLSLDALLLGWSPWVDRVLGSIGSLGSPEFFLVKTHGKSGLFWLFGSQVVFFPSVFQ